MKPEQLEEFESAFRAFDKEGTNRLGLDELVGALGSLGVAEIVSLRQISAPLSLCRIGDVGLTQAEPNRVSSCLVSRISRRFNKMKKTKSRSRNSFVSLCVCFPPFAFVHSAR